MIHHAYGCTCNSRECRRARAQRGFDVFLAMVLAGLYAFGIYSAAWFIHDALTR